MTTRRLILHRPVVLLLAICLVCSNCSSESPANGKLTSDTYANAYFSMRLPLPQGWAVASKDIENRIRDAGQALSEDNALAKLRAKFAAQDTHQLLTISQHPIGAPVASNVLIQVFAERVSHAPGITTGGDYLYHTVKLLTSGNLSYGVDKEPYLSKLGNNQEFYRTDLRLGLGNQALRQVYMATLIRGYVLAFVVTAAGDETQSQEAVKLLDKVYFY